MYVYEARGATGRGGVQTCTRIMQPRDKNIPYGIIASYTVIRVITHICYPCVGQVAVVFVFLAVGSVENRRVLVRKPWCLLIGTEYAINVDRCGLYRALLL